MSSRIANVRDATDSRRISAIVVMRSTADVGSSVAQLAPHERGERGWVAGRAHDEMLRERPRLPERQVDLGLGGLTQLFGARVGHDADDLERLVGAAGEPQVCADRIAVRVVPSWRAWH